MNTSDILNDLETFTANETDRINLIAAGALPDEEITLDDAKLFARWQTSNAIANERFQIEREAAQAEMRARIDQAQAVNDAAIANLQAQAALAQARLKAVENGEI